MRPAPFLITGLPRSRTAWWSVVASSPQSICLHEPLRDCASFDELRAVWFALSLPYVGVSDSGLAFQLGRVLAEIEPRTLIIERDRDDALRSFEEYMGADAIDRDRATTYFRECEAALDRHRTHPLVRIVRFDELSSFNVVTDCFRWLMPGNHWPLRRDLFGMRVQVDRDCLAAAVAKPHSLWWHTS